MKNILIIEDHPIMASAMQLLVEEHFSPCTVYPAKFFSKAMEIVTNTPLDLVIMDIYVPEGGNTSMIKSMRSRQRSIPILVYTGRDEKTHAIAYIKAGANGFISKNAPEEEMVKAIDMIMSGKKYFSNDLWELVITNFAENNTTGLNPMETLTRRELQVMELVLAGKWTKEIAEELHLKESTISTHKLNIFQKMGVTNAIELFKKIEQYTS